MCGVCVCVCVMCVCCSEVLDNIIDDMPLLCDSTPPVLSTPIKVCSDCSSVVTLSEGGDRECEVVLNAPTAYGIRLDREPVTYLNRGIPHSMLDKSSSLALGMYLPPNARMPPLTT